MRIKGRMGSLTHCQEVDVMCDDIAKPLTRFSNVRNPLLTLKNALSRKGRGETGYVKPRKSFHLSRFTFHPASPFTFSFSPFKLKKSTLSGKNARPTVHLFHFTFPFSPVSAFTLAEVLIVVGIIGIIAESLIPNLIHETRENIFKTSYKKAYSDVSRALLKAKQEGSVAELSGKYGGIGSKANFEAIKNQFLVIKDCNKNNLSDCWDTSGERWRDESVSQSTPAFVDKSGIVWKLRMTDNNGAAAGIQIDVNGQKGPNQYGRDRFPFAYKNYIGTWNTVKGLPTSIAPYPSDVKSLSDTSTCPSVATHPCYYKSWLLE